jgi:hypothetical protein
MKFNSEAAQIMTKGFSFLQLITILFIALKLLGKITWSWWWVLAPLWMPFGILAAVLICGIIAITFYTYILNK